MKKSFKNFVCSLTMISFVSMCMMSSAPAFSAVKTGSVKIFSEIKGIEIYIDGKHQGTDMAELNNVEVGSHYLKVTKDGGNIYSKLITVRADTATTVLIENTGQAEPKSVAGKYKEEQEYKSKKLDILLTKQVNTYGSGYNSYYPNYYSILGGYGWTNTSSVAYESVDFKIIQGGVQEISDTTFAKLTGDTELKARIDRAWEKRQETVDAGNNWALGGAIAAGAALVVYLLAPVTKYVPNTLDTKSAAVVVGLMACTLVVVAAQMANQPAPSGHFILPGDAAKIAFNYNQKLKASLGLPESFEPQQ